MRSTRVLAFLCLTAVLTACAPADDSALVAELDEMRERVTETESRLEEMERALQQRERRRVGLEQDVRRLGEQRVAARTSTDETVAEASEAIDIGAPAPAATATASSFDAFLETEEGTDVLARAMRRYQDRRDEERRKRVVSALVQPFAEKAYLSQDQAERMSEALESAAQNIRDAWTSMRDVPPEQRAQAVQKNIARTQEIRRETDEAIESMLNASQYEMYETERSTLLGTPGSPPRRNEDRPGR